MKAEFSKVFLRDRGKSGKAAYQIPTGDNRGPCARIICRTLCCAVFPLDAQVHARQSFLKTQAAHF